MRGVPPLAERLSPDTIVTIERAAQHRYETAEVLRTQPKPRRLATLYFYGYSAEMWLSAAYYRSAGFRPHDRIDRDTRHRRMVQARQLRTPSGEPVMSTDPHPLVGWARFLEWQRSAPGPLAPADAHRLREAVKKAVLIYSYWRPELRYKVVEITEAQVNVVRAAVVWLRDNREKLSEG